MDTPSKFTLPGILFILTLAFGFWLSSAGKPYNGFLFNFHKLIALSGVVIGLLAILLLLVGGGFVPTYIGGSRQRYRESYPRAGEAAGYGFPFPGKTVAVDAAPDGGLVSGELAAGIFFQPGHVGVGRGPVSRF